MHIIPEIGKQEKRMTQRISTMVFYCGCVVLMALAILQVAQAEQTVNVSNGAWQPHRPDNLNRPEFHGGCLV